MGFYVVEGFKKITDCVYDTVFIRTIEYSPSVCGEFKMPPSGSVIIIPCTFKMGQTSTFNITAYNTSSRSKDPIKLL